MGGTTATVTVPVAPATESKTNWTALAGPVASILVWIGLPVSPETATAIIVGIQAVQSIVTIIWRTYFTSSVTPQVAEKLE